ncbi:DUF1127 domain-containing protein [Vibrio furnissii]|uniref:DUF1127 domain-containing protein n=1 Tax=Vibrio furnissii TaxID=29494 RepID=UPI00375086EC
MNVTHTETSSAHHEIPRDSLNAFLSQLMLWRHNYRTRRQLRELPPHLLKDLGLEQDQVQAEANKYFWR